MSDDKGMLAGEASLWVQINGPNTKPEYLGCHQMGDVAEPQGDVTLTYCPDPRAAGKYKVSRSYQGEPGPVTGTIETTIKRVQDWLEKIACPFTLFVHKVSCGRRDVFANWDRSFVFDSARITNKGLAGLASRTPGDETESMQSFDFSAEANLRLLSVSGTRQDIGATGDLAAITFCNEAKCADACGPASDICQYGFVVGPNPAASAALPAETWYTEDGGGTWTEVATHPFAAGEDISAVVCFPISRTVTRVIVARGSTDAGNPAEIAYSDDNGATWTNVDVGAVDGQYVLESEGLFALDMNHIWLVTQDGYIYVSYDGGVTWTVQEAGVLTATGWNAIEFIDPSHGWVVGDNSEIAYTDDGGASWNAVAGPAGKAADEIESLAVIDENTIWIGWSDGDLYYTENAGADWYQRTIPVTATIIPDIDFVSELVGFLVATVGGVGHVLRTIDGGYTWQDLPFVTNGGLAAVYACDNNTAFVVGPVNAGTGFVGKVFPE